MDLLSPDSGTIFWTVLTFVILLLILKKYAWKPILKTLEDRENKIKMTLYEAEQSQKNAEKSREEQAQLLEKLKKESAELFHQNKLDAENARKKLMDQAREDAENLLVHAKNEIELSKLDAINDIRKYAVDLSIAAAKKVIGENFTEKDHLDLIEKSIQELTKSNEN